MLIAVFRNFFAPDELHDKIRWARFRCACIKYLGNVWMIHQCKRLSLSLKACNNAFCVHSQLDNFQGYSPPNRLLLLRHVNHTTSAFANLLQQLVAADTIAWLFIG